MTARGRTADVWMVITGVSTLIALHAIILYFFSSHVALPVTVIGGVVLLLAAKHLGMLATLHGRFSRRSRKARSVDD
jgi:hypothetical protein